MANDGYIKLFRSMMSWEWYTDASTMRVFLHILLNANHCDKEYRGMTIRRGQWLTSYGKIAAALGLSKKQVRLSIDKLKRTQEVRTSRARDGAQCGLLINVEKYSLYQSNERDEGHEVGYHKGHDEGTTRAPNKNEKNVKNIKVSKDTLSSKAEKDPRKADREEVIRYLNEKTGRKYKPSTESTKKLINGRFREGFTVEDFKKVIDNKSKEWLGHPKMDRFLRPETLFAPSHFEGYLNESGDPPEVDELTARLGTVL